MNYLKLFNLQASCVLAIFLSLTYPARAANGNTVIGWNDLGMHCMDGVDFSVFSILPPFNNIHAHLIANGQLITDTNSYTLTYEAVADPSGSINTTSQGKGNFWDYVLDMYGVSLPVDTGLAGYKMPGANNIPQPMGFDATENWFTGEGIPLTPYDDNLVKNPYPMMRVVARSKANNTVIATTDIVLPVSDEMDCKACHLSGSYNDAKPLGGWEWNADRNKDYKLNILRLHDQYQANYQNKYATMLAAAHYSTNGLYDTVVKDGVPVLCANCHPSNALPAMGQNGITPLTQAIHGFHAYVMDPDKNMLLEDSANRASCYRCHPGSSTKCLRGAMGSAVAADGSMEMQCQSCHGTMSAVGRGGRDGWLEEPNCQACHTGTAVQNSGLIRFTTALETNGTLRVPVNTTFATQPNTPAAGVSLYRFSKGHGGLQCEACHGSTHAEYPSSHTNDNVQSFQLQGHVGMLSECTVCHGTSPSTVKGGPHGMHPVGQVWVNSHPNVVESSGSTQCKVCHGTDYRGTVLSRSKADRNINGKGSHFFWRGYQIGCYTCHNGPSNEDQTNPNPPATVANAIATTLSGVPIAIPLSATDPNGNALTLRIVTQPSHGTMGISNRTALYFPDANYTGPDSFTYAAWNGSADSNLGQGQINVATGPFGLGCTSVAAPEVPANKAAPFWATPTATNYTGSVSFDWDFGDNSAHDTNQYAAHAYTIPGQYTWTLIASAKGVTVTNTGSIMIDPAALEPPTLSIERQGTNVILSWSMSYTNFVLETADVLAVSNFWSQASSISTLESNRLVVTEGVTNTARYYRLRQKTP